MSKAIQINPNRASSYNNLGNVLVELIRLDEALLDYDKAIAIKPDYSEAYNNRGRVLAALGRFEEALISYDKAIEIKSDYAEAHNNRGFLLLVLKRFKGALVDFNRAIAIKSDFAEAMWNLSLYYLLVGDFNSGWQYHEFRFKNKSLNISDTRDFYVPQWLGAESLQDKTILLHAEQGLGDTIQFCRYVPLVAKLGAKVILEVQRPLVRLLSGLEGVSLIVARGDKIPVFDYHCALLSLPLAFRTELHTIPSVSRSIVSDKSKAANWATTLGKKTKPRVGLVWSGNTSHKNDRNRSLVLSQLLPYLPSNCEYVSLQKEIRDTDREVLVKQSGIRHFGSNLNDFTDTAALCELMDVVMSVDTSVAHLAGTLGRPTWVLLPFLPDWRWLLDREDSPWYPSLKLYRQEKIDNWDSVLEKVKTDLEKMVLV